MLLRGNAVGQLTPGQIEELDHAFARAHYFELDDDYTSHTPDGYSSNGVIDSPHQITTYHLGRRTKTIDHYSVASLAPPELSQLEDSIDAIVGVDRWIGTPAERQAHLLDWH